MRTLTAEQYRILSEGGVTYERPGQAFFVLVENGYFVEVPSAPGMRMSWESTEAGERTERAHLAWLEAGCPASGSGARS